jgi:hypothetical protein
MSSEARKSNAFPLTLVLPLKEDVDISKLLAYLGQENENICNWMDAIGTVHYARFVLLDASTENLKPAAGSRGPYKLAVITTYDGDFEMYIRAFTEHLSEVFDTLLRLTIGGEELTPVRDRVDALTAWVKENDASQQGGRPPSQYGAYAHTVQAIKAKFGE